MRNPSVAMLVWMLSAPAVFAAPQTYKIDPGHTYENFTINHLGFSNLFGQMARTEGTIVMDRGGTGSRVDVIIQPGSVYTGNAKRDEHLRNMGGFFDVSKYPSIHFKSTRVSYTDKDRALVKGNLTMHGVTRPVTLKVSHISCGKNPIVKDEYTCGFNATTSLKRSSFGMDAFLPEVGDEVHIMVEVEADRPLHP